MPQRRRISAVPEDLDDLTADENGLIELDNDTFEQIVTTIAGTLPLPVAEPDLFYYYGSDGVAAQAKFLLIRSFEPLLRNVIVPEWVEPPFVPSGVALDGDSGLLLLERVEKTLLFPQNVAGDSVGNPIHRIIIDSSHERLLVQFKNDLDDVAASTELRLSRRAIDKFGISAQEGPVLRQITPDDLFR